MAKPEGQDSPSFLDTNVLVYSFDESAKEKQNAADDLIRRLSNTGSLYVSVQVLNETYWNLTSPRKGFKLSADKARSCVLKVAEVGTVVNLTLDISLDAYQASERHQIAFWDALIWSAAKAAGCSVLYSEDFQHGQVLEGIRFENPFV